ncbi:MAG: hypothetical protein JJU06_15130 [Ectothiorhodospiraceae bacterium]|nr:hypothetical protein [Ectothiorhodospiraceae bacterium]
MIVYVLYGVGFFTGFTALVGVIMAHLKQNEASEWLRSHFQYQIRTFYIGLAAIILGAVLSIVLIGWLILLAWTVWAIVRIVVGLMQITSNKPIPNPTAWGTGL